MRGRKKFSFNEDAASAKSRIEEPESLIEWILCHKIEKIIVNAMNSSVWELHLSKLSRVSKTGEPFCVLPSRNKSIVRISFCNRYRNSLEL